MFASSFSVYYCVHIVWETVIKYSHRYGAGSTLIFASLLWLIDCVKASPCQAPGQSKRDESLIIFTGNCYPRIKTRHKLIVEIVKLIFPVVFMLPVNTLFDKWTWFLSGQCFKPDLFNHAILITCVKTLISSPRAAAVRSACLFWYYQNYIALDKTHVDFA